MSREVRRVEEQARRLAQIEAQVKEQAAIIQHLAVINRTEVSLSHSGPFPHPAVLSDYKDHHLEVYDAMLARYNQETQMVRDEQLHRHSLDRSNVKNTA